MCNKLPFSYLVFKLQKKKKHGTTRKQCIPDHKKQHAELFITNKSCDMLSNTTTFYLEVKVKIKVKYRNLITGLGRPIGFQEVEATRFQDNWHMKVVRLSAPCTGRL
jgi:hypothetical protein